MGTKEQKINWLEDYSVYRVTFFDYEAEQENSRVIIVPGHKGITRAIELAEAYNANQCANITRVEFVGFAIASKNDFREMEAFNRRIRRVIREYGPL